MTQLNPQMTNKCTIHMLPIRNIVSPVLNSCSLKSSDLLSLLVMLVEATLVESLEPSVGIGFPFSSVTKTAVAAVLALALDFWVVPDPLLSTSDSLASLLTSSTVDSAPWRDEERVERANVLAAPTAITAG